MKLVIVESPAKAKTINKYLGKDYQVLASYGHIRDLPSKNGSVEPDNDFKMHWELSAGGKKNLKEIIAAVDKADTIVLASDPDREGEAIAWHLLEELKDKKKIKDKKIQRVVFNEITKTAVNYAIENPRQIDQDLVSAYMARRALDYLVGFTLSPVLWRKLPGSRSAGRVQSVALRLICERENEIEKFKTQEYWSVDVDLMTSSKALIKSRLTHLDGIKLEKFDINSEEKALDAKAKIEKQEFHIANVERKKVNRYPYAPFITSTLQQEGARKLRFSAKRTMQVAQKLYENGHISYMRTDAVNLSNDAITACRDLILKEFGQSYLPKEPKLYKNKAKNVQEGHEAIRPSDLFMSPEKLRGKLDSDEYNLYELIWKRTVACQMNPAIMDRVSIDSNSKDGKITLRATGQVIAFDGFLKLYQESKDDTTDDDEDDENKLLPNVNEGDNVDRGEICTNQHFTAPPPRFTEATLVKKLEELGIGRPSTYASIIAVLQERKYVVVDKLRFIPEDRGRIVTVFLENYFGRYVEYDFTAQLETFLDEISAGEREWKTLLTSFWSKFITNIEAVAPLTITEVIEKIEEALEFHLFPPRADGSNPRSCPKCENGKLNVKLGKFGAFLGCSNYPECKYTKELTSGDDEDGKDSSNGISPEVKELGVINDLKVYLKKGPYGFYLQHGEEATKTTEKPKRVAIPKEINPDEMTFEQAQLLISLPKDLGEGIEVNIGRYGPYLKQGTKNKSLVGADNVFNVTLLRAKEILSSVMTKAEAIVVGTHPKLKADITLQSGRYGPYLKCGKSNYALPKALQGKEVSLEDAIKVIDEKK